MDTTAAVDGALMLVLSFLSMTKHSCLTPLVSYPVRELRKVAEGHGPLRYPVLIFGRVAQFGLVVVVHVVGHGETLCS